MGCVMKNKHFMVNLTLDNQLAFQVNNFLAHYGKNFFELNNDVTKRHIANLIATFGAYKVQSYAQVTRKLKGA